MDSDDVTTATWTRDVTEAVTQLLSSPDLKTLYLWVGVDPTATPTSNPLQKKMKLYSSLSSQSGESEGGLVDRLPVTSSSLETSEELRRHYCLAKSVSSVTFSNVTSTIPVLSLS